MNRTNATRLIVALLLTLGLSIGLVTVNAGAIWRSYLPLVVRPNINQGGGSNLQISVGAGYTDVSPKQIVRTSDNRIYIAASDCNAYPCISTSQTLRMYRATTTGVPGGFTRADSSHEPSGVAGWAIAVDSSNTIHVAWTDRTASASRIDRLRYTTFNTATNTWGTTETLEGALNVATGSGGQGIQSVALALDANGIPHVVYLKNATRRMFYRNHVGGSWSAATQIDDTTNMYTGNQQAWHPNLAFDPVGRILAIWERGTSNDTADGTIFSRVRSEAGVWGASVAVSSSGGALTSIDQSTSIVITPDGTYHTTYINASTTHSQKVIRYRYSTDQGATWNANDPAGGTIATHNPSLGYANGKLRIYGHGVPDSSNHGNDLYYFEGTGDAASWGSWTKFIAGANLDSSVNVRWSQNFNNFPNTIDIVYWGDAYPNLLFAGSQ